MIASVLAMPALAWSIGRLRLVDGRLRPELSRGELLGAIERQLRHHRLRLEVGEVALVGRVEQLHQRTARLHGRTGLEHDLGDAPANIGGDIDLMHGGEIADRGEQVRNHFGLGVAMLTGVGGGCVGERMRLMHDWRGNG